MLPPARVIQPRAFVKSWCPVTASTSRNSLSREDLMDEVVGVKISPNTGSTFSFSFQYDH